MNEIIQYDKIDLDDLIDQLPDQFFGAQDMIKYEIAPHLVDCSAGITDTLEVTISGYIRDLVEKHLVKKENENE